MNSYLLLQNIFFVSTLSFHLYDNVRDMFVMVCSMKHLIFQSSCPLLTLYLEATIKGRTYQQKRIKIVAVI